MDVKIDGSIKHGYLRAEEKTAVPKETAIGWKLWKRRRNVVGFMVFLGTMTAHTLRANLVIAIVTMAIDKDAEFSWDSHLRGFVLGAFYYGYICTQFFGGWLSARIGGKRVFGFGIGITAILTLGTPYLTRTSVYLLVALRIMEGLFQGVVFPSMQSIWAQWAPPLERTTYVSMSIAGSSVGWVIAMLSGAFAAHLGWPSIFYATGAVGILWFALWLRFSGSDKPEDDSWITQEEIEFINFSINQNRSTDESKKISHPWKAMLSSAPVWALFVTHFSSIFGNSTLILQLPSLMKDLWGFQTDVVGFSVAISCIGYTFIAMTSGPLADRLRSNGCLTTTQVRKIIVCSGFVLQALVLISMGQVSSKTGALICLILSNCMDGLVISGYIVNFLDIGSQHASVLLGIGNTFGTIGRMVGPSLIGCIVQNQKPAEWRIVLLILAALYIFGAVIFGLFGSGEEQQWSVDSRKKRSSSVKRS